MRLHIQQGPCATLTVADGRTTFHSAAGSGCRCARRLKRIWQRLPVWDELSAGVQLSSLFPPTATGVSTPAGRGCCSLFHQATTNLTREDRLLGHSGDGRALTLELRGPAVHGRRSGHVPGAAGTPGLGPRPDSHRRFTAPPRPGADGSQGTRHTHVTGWTHRAATGRLTWPLSLPRNGHEKTSTQLSTPPRPFWPIWALTCTCPRSHRSPVT